MLHLYFSLASKFLFLALMEKDKCLAKKNKKNYRLHSENFLFYLQQILAKINRSLKEISEFYFTSTPSGQTGIRISLVFLTTLKILNPQIKIYHLDTLLLQAGNKSCFSLLTINSSETKHHCAVYKKKRCLFQYKVVQSHHLKKILKQFPDFLIIKDFQTVDFLGNFQELKKEFTSINRIEEINY